MRSERDERAKVPTGAVRAHFRSALLGWTDPESGEHVTISFRGGWPEAEDFVLELERAGFERLAAESAAGRAEDVRIVRLEIR